MRRGVTLDTDPVTMATSVEGVFAGGDVVRGLAVIDAVATAGSPPKP
jgi:thioredoxin reductase